ncbi:hypothetical protein C0992_000039 [Termitomyces sp. T32_za158]|nr:hypothetical protein C0992_000039 [Termitomyces sp. T32_za158]
MPPRHGKKLADVMDEAFRSNGKAVDEANAEKAQSDGQSEAPNAPLNAETVSAPAKSQSTGKVKGYTFQLTSVYPPQPCERCVRSKKTCRGIAGARCENCKSLHQKCSNSSGPPRGRHAGKFYVSIAVVHEAKLHPFTVTTAVCHNSKSPSVENDSTSAEPARTKRKQATKAKQTYAAEDEDDEDTSNPVAKKRRVSEDARTNALKDVAELEASVRKLQAFVTKDLKHLAQLAATLAAQLKDMD